MKTKIALIQQTATGNKEFNIERGIKAVKESAANKANIICFSELAFSQFYPQKPASRDYLNLAETIPGPTTEVFAKLSKELNTVIVLNVYERDGEKTYDSSPLINNHGKILGITRMIHITEYACFHEQSYYLPGDKDVPVFETEFGKIGIAICYDRHYPEYMRMLALNGAEIVFIPQAGAVSEWPDGLYEAEMQVAAFQNGYFTALCNRVGEEECLTFAGESFVCSPTGEIIARADRSTDEILYAELDLSEINNSYARKLFMRDRRPDLYSKWFGC